jgi:peptidoglycan/LPS O-acetylase OafA/YrhL
MVGTGREDRPRIDSLTGLRFFAALAVFVHHTLAGSIVPGGLAQVPGTRALALVGLTGVTFFFVLSGFVLTWSWDDARPVWGFYGRRLARIWPLHALTFALAVLVILPFLDRPGTSVTQVALVLPLLQAWVPDPTIYFAGNGPSWSLSCELFFYAMVPLLILRLRHHGRRVAYLGVVACFGFLVLVPVAFYALQFGRYAMLSLWVFPPYRLGEFLLGVIAGLAMRKGWRPRWSVSTAAIACAASYAFAAWALGDVFRSPVRADRPLASLYSDALVVLPFAALIVAVAARDVAGRRSWLASPLAVRLGAGSFAFYLIHSMVVLLAAELPSGARALSGVPLTAAVLVVAVVVADVLHRWYERPIELRVRRVISAREAPRAAA